MSRKLTFIFVLFVTKKAQGEWVIPMNFREYNDATQGGRIFVPISVG